MFLPNHRDKLNCLKNCLHSPDYLCRAGLSAFGMNNNNSRNKVKRRSNPSFKTGLQLEAHWFPAMPSLGIVPKTWEFSETKYIWCWYVENSKWLHFSPSNITALRGLVKCTLLGHKRVVSGFNGRLHRGPENLLQPSIISMRVKKTKHHESILHLRHST